MSYFFQRRPLDLPAATLPQDITGSWADVGSYIDVKDYSEITFAITVDINSSENVRFRCVSTLENSGTPTEYVSTIATVSASNIAIEDEFIELTDDADQSFLVTFKPKTPYIKLQVQAGTVGATAGQVDAVKTIAAVMPS